MSGRLADYLAATAAIDAAHLERETNRRERRELLTPEFRAALKTAGWRRGEIRRWLREGEPPARIWTGP